MWAVIYMTQFNRLMLFTYLFLRDKLFNLYYISIIYLPDITFLIYNNIIKHNKLINVQVNKYYINKSSLYLGRLLQLIH